MACLVMGASACGDDAAEGSAAGAGLASSKGDLPTGFTADGTPPPIAGSYRFELVSEVTTRDEGGLFTSPTETTSTVRVDGVIEATQDGSAFTFYLAPCGIALPEVAGYEPMVDQGTIRRLPAVVSTPSDGISTAHVVGNFRSPFGRAADDVDQQ